MAGRGAGARRHRPSTSTATTRRWRRSLAPPSRGVARHQGGSAVKISPSTSRCAARCRPRGRRRRRGARRRRPTSAPSRAARRRRQRVAALLAVLCASAEEMARSDPPRVAAAGARRGARPGAARGAEALPRTPTRTAFFASRSSRRHPPERRIRRLGPFARSCARCSWRRSTRRSASRCGSTCTTCCACTAVVAASAAAPRHGHPVDAAAAPPLPLRRGRAAVLGHPARARHAARAAAAPAVCRAAVVIPKFVPMTLGCARTRRARSSPSEGHPGTSSRRRCASSAARRAAVREFARFLAPRVGHCDRPRRWCCASRTWRTTRPGAITLECDRLLPLLLEASPPRSTRCFSSSTAIHGLVHA